MTPLTVPVFELVCANKKTGNKNEKTSENRIINKQKEVVFTRPQLTNTNYFTTTRLELIVPSF